MVVGDVRAAIVQYRRADMRLMGLFIAHLDRSFECFTLKFFRVIT
jgi:hypothetical protein